jgi:hypothetical protein
MNSGLPVVWLRSQLSSVWRSHSSALSASQGRFTSTWVAISSSWVTASTMSPATTGSTGAEPKGVSLGYSSRLPPPPMNTLLPVLYVGKVSTPTSLASAWMWSCVGPVNIPPSSE